MKFVTFNIRCDYQQDENNCFVYRKSLILDKLNNEHPDIICFQEVLPHVAAWLKHELHDYTILGCGRCPDLDSEQTCIAVRKEAFQIISMDTFWLSPTPRTPGSRYENQSECPRTATEVFVQELSTGRLYDIFNTHLDHISSEARICGMEQLLTQIQDSQIQKDAFGKIGILLAGDFNAFPDTEEIKRISKDGFLQDFTEGISGTFHDYGRTQPPEKIDYIAGSSNIHCNQVSLWTDQYNGVYLSDHYPICAIIEEA